jgi:two-component system, OmpR family, sensor kinase
LKPVESLGSYTRSAARATFSAYKSLPIRWRLAGGSAVLTFVILAAFAALVGVLTSNQVRGQFNDDVSRAGDQLQRELNHKLKFVGPTLNCENTTVHLSDYAATEHAQIRIFVDGELYCTQSSLRSKGAKAPFNTSLFILPPGQGTGEFNQASYRVAVRRLAIAGGGDGMLIYARPLSDVDQTLAHIQFFLLLGVLGGTVLALLAGLATAQRAMRPIAQLTEAAREIERTRDPGLRLPHPEADDEIEELARTLDGMLQSLDAAHAEMGTMLDRQREFVADASHELRTPLTSVLANLELLAEELEGEQAESAQAALRSTRRMRRLVGDLLLLARADAKRADTHHPMNLADVLLEAASELGPVAEDHDLSIDAQPVVVSGARDDLHRLTLNLIENAVRHTPPGTHIRASTASDNGDAVLTVDDDGPGIPPELERRVFERFVRGGGEGGRGSGLGLAIVHAVAAAHGGSVLLEHPKSGTGTRFVIRIPTGVSALARDHEGDPARQPVPASAAGASSGRRRRRS